MVISAFDFLTRPMRWTALSPLALLLLAVAPIVPAEDLSPFALAVLIPSPRVFEV